MEKLLKEKRAIVTGSTRGLGLAIARGLANDGAQVLVVGRSEEACEKAAASIREIGGTAAPCAADLAAPQSPEKIVETCLGEFGGIDILVNNAGVFVWKPFFDLSRDDFENTISINLAASFHLGQHAARAMAKQGGGGAVLNIASIHGKVGDGNVVPHCAAKFGLVGLTKAMAEALREHAIRVNAICPGAIAADSADRRSTSIAEKVTQADVATLAVFLVSDLSHSITGATMDMPGSTRVVIKG